jgi:hypothetical protein
MYTTRGKGRLGSNGALQRIIRKDGDVFAVSAKEGLKDGSEGFVTIKAVFGPAGPSLATVCLPKMDHELDSRDLVRNETRPRPTTGIHASRTPDGEQKQWKRSSGCTYQLERCSKRIRLTLAVMLTVSSSVSRKGTTYL